MLDVVVHRRVSTGRGNEGRQTDQIICFVTAPEGKLIMISYMAEAVAVTWFLLRAFFLKMAELDLGHGSFFRNGYRSLVQ